MEGKIALYYRLGNFILKKHEPTGPIQNPELFKVFLGWFLLSNLKLELPFDSSNDDLCRTCTGT